MRQIINHLESVMVSVENLIIGGGQAGLALSYYLAEMGVEHIVLEKSREAASAWRSRWDSFTLVTPNWAFRMPGAEKNNRNRDGFMTRSEVVAFFENYIKDFRLPVEFNTRVVSVEKVDNNGYLVQTNQKTYKSKNVAIAAGFFQHPKIPYFSGNISKDITQIHSSEYRNPESVPGGAVLVIGSGQSGSQIAEELHQAGRKVFLSVGRAGRLPRRYRGRDIIEWMDLAGFFDLTPEQLPPGMSKFSGIPHLSGTKGGHTINLHRFAKDGITLAGHVGGAENEKVFIKPDLYESLKITDQFESDCISMLDAFIEEKQFDAPPESLPRLSNGYDIPLTEEINLKHEGISTIIWAGGYRFDYSFIKLPVLDPDGFPVQRRGVSDYPGLYFVGIPWMPSEKSGFLVGVGEHAQFIASQMEISR